MPSSTSPDPISRRRRALSLWPLTLPLGGVAMAREAPHTAAWPRRAIHITVAYPPGGVSDQMARALAEVLAADLGVPVVIENKAGASGTLALELLVRRPADGYSLCFVAATAIALRAQAANHRGVALRAALPVAGVMRTPILVVGTRSLGVDGFARMVDRARQSPGSVRWATTGEGTTGYAVLDRVRRASRTEIVHIPYKGGGQQLLDALAGHFEVLSTNVASAQLEDIAAGRLVALAVGAPVRLRVLPDTPTLAELGYDDANLDSLFGLFAPPDLPEALADRLNRAVAAALETPALQSRLRSMSNLPFEGSADAFAQQIAREARR
ncbi:Bug family tripartite tricarboxylate transporter substrate binding protein [Variovorax boronicumulans]|uniref:Bug family tripartite tricarboxylate transporter substrate binding protein n=1 Tax=Variovorax boronicumulans TaxID=436515 RepID=UPI00214BDD27